MTREIICLISILSIPLLILSAETQSNVSLKERTSSLGGRNRTHANLKQLSLFAGHHELSNIDGGLQLSREHFGLRKRSSKSSKKKRQILHLSKTPQHSQRSLNTHSIPQRGKDEKIYETFEEIHEHINEPEDHDAGNHQVADRYESHEETITAEEQKKDNVPVKIKVKHHHHHHHHNHIKEIIKTVPKPYKVEKIIHVPIEKVVEKIVHVPKIVNVTVEKIVHVPVEKIIEKVIQVPKPVHIPKPYVVEKIMEKIIHVPKPYPVMRTVPYPVEIKVPVPIEKKVPVPYKVEVERKIPIYIHDQDPYKYEPIYTKSYRDKDNSQSHSDNVEPSNSEKYPSYFINEYSANKFNNIRHTEMPSSSSKFEFQRYNQPTEQRVNYDYSKPVEQTTMEQSTAESTFVPVKFLESNPQFNIIVADNNTSLDIGSQSYHNKFNELPLPFPVEFIQLQPMPFKSQFKLELPYPQAAAFNST